MEEDIIKKIRSCLISTKGKITLRQLEDDFRTLLGERIPYSKLGYPSLEAFIQSIPSLITSRGPNGECLVDAQVTEKTAHISSMVSKQKPIPKKKVRISHHPRFNRAMAHPPPTTPKWRPKHRSMMPHPRPHFNRLAAVSHNQFVSGGGYKKPAVASKVVVPPPRENVNNLETKKPSPPKELRRHNSSPEATVVTTNGDDCSPLTSTMKRISRLMSEITVERDSGNSSPTAEYAATYKEFTKTGDPVADLRSFAAFHKLGDVEVRFTETKAKKSKIAQWHCVLTVSQHKYSSYPEDFYDKAAAERHASQKALDDLSLKYSKRHSLLLSGNMDIIERIPPMLEKHTGAVWMWQIEADYTDVYNEQLPPNWLQIIDSSPFVSIEKYSGGYVLMHCNPDDALQKGKKIDMTLNVGDVSVPCNTVNLAENNRLYAVVTAAHSTNELWCQATATSGYEKFEALVVSMEQFYGSKKSELLAKNIHFGSCYVVRHDGGWIRVRALDMAQEGVVDCFMIDYGEEIHVPVDGIYVLKREFALVQAQAFVCRLSGLEEFVEVSMESEHLASLVGKEYILEFVVEEPGDDDITIPIVMYDVTSSASINEELISLLSIESAQPVLDKNAITEVYVSHIEPNGDVYVQVRSVGYQRFTERLKDVCESISKNPHHLPTTPTPETSRGRTYLIRCKVSQKWKRAVFLDWGPNGNLAQIYFIDVGNCEVINVAQEKMYRLDALDDALNQYPDQAVKVRIMIDHIPEDFVQRAERLLPNDKPVLLRIHSHDNENVPWVEFFKRTNDGVLVFINKNISVEAELRSLDGNSNMNESSRKRLINLVQFDGKTVPSGGYLKKPELPKMGDYFNVNVPFSVNPWNFFVQPLDSFDQLTALMGEMQECYKDVRFSPASLDDIVPGKIYASKHDDGLWYRTSVLKVIHASSISVFYCDFGYYTNLKLQQLVPLDPKFMGLPYQALKAKVDGIKPVKDKWTMEDCDVFNSLVSKRQFVSIVVNIEKDEFYKSDLVLSLLLIDTSSDEDVHIKEVLIEKGIASSV